MLTIRNKKDVQYKICHPEIKTQEHPFVFPMKEEITIHFFQNMQTREGDLISLDLTSVVEV